MYPGYAYVPGVGCRFKGGSAEMNVINHDKHHKYHRSDIIFLHIYIICWVFRYNMHLSIQTYFYVHNDAERLNCNE